MKKKVLSILLALVMVVSLVPERVMAGTEPVTYLKWDDTKKVLVEDSCESYTTVDANIMSWGSSSSSSWYVVSESVYIDGRVDTSGDVHLILCDGATLTVTMGITVSGDNSLTIYGQRNETGTLKVTKVDGAGMDYHYKQSAGIGGGNNEKGGIITINGGIIDTKAGTNGGAGIGGGNNSAGGIITINGGKITAKGSSEGAGIGGGYYGAGGTITVNGGTVTAYSQNCGAGIGSGYYGAGGTVYISDDLEIKAGDTADTASIVSNDAFTSSSYKYVYASEKHGHANVNFNIWVSTTSLPDNPGNYFLAADVTLSSVWSVPTGTTNLCLNGHVIKAAGSGYSAIAVGTGNTLNLYECSETEHYFKDSTTSSGLWEYQSTQNSDTKHTVKGGVITGFNTESVMGLIDVTGGTVVINGINISGNQGRGVKLSEDTQQQKVGQLVLNSGSICGNITASGYPRGAGVYIANGIFTMNGGCIADNSTPNYAGGVYIDKGSFTMTGGSIKNNSGSWGGGLYINANTAVKLEGGEIINNCATSYGGGVFATKNAKVTVGGNAIVKNNKVVNASVTGLEQSNIHLQDNNKQIFSVLSDPSLTDGADIGVTLYFDKADDWKPGIEMASYFGNTLTSDNYKYFTINNSGSVDKGTVYRVAQIGTSSDLYYVRGGNFSVTGYTDPATPSLGSVTPDETTCEDGATVTLTVSPTERYMLTEGSLKASYTDPADTGKSIECVLTKDAQDSSKYTFTMPAANVTVTAAFEKLAAKVSKVPEADANLVYSGEAQALVTAGEAENGTMQYALGENATTAPATGWNTTIPTGISADTYYVWYKAAGSDGALDSAAACVTVTISKRVPAEPTGLDSVKPSEIGKNDGKITGTTTAMEYGTDVDFSDAKPCTGTEITGLAAGTYYVRIKETANESASNYVSVTVSDGDKKNFTTVVIDNYSGVYDGAAHGITVSGVPAGATVMYGTTEGTYDMDSISYTDFTDGAKTVFIKVSAENYNNWFGSGTVTIAKRVPAAPTGLAGVKPSEIGKNDGKITGTTTAMEYGTDVDFSDAKPCTGDEITGLAAGTYYVRIKETANESASNYVSVTISDGDKKNFTTVVIDNYSGVYDGAAHGITVSGVPAGATVMYGTTEGTYDMDSISYTDFTDGVKTVFVKVSAENYNNWFGSGTVTITKRVPAAPTGLAGVKPSEIGKNDGKITGTTAAMEYSTADDFSSATDCTGTEITGLAAGTYYVRIKETANESASNYVSVTISDGDKKNFTTVVIDNYNGVYDGEAHGITVSGVPAGATVKFGTVRGTYDMDSVTYTDVTNGAKTVFVKVSAENYNNWFGSGTVTIVMKTPTPEPPVPTPEPPVPTPELPITTDIYEASLKGENTVKVEAVLKNGNADIKEIASKELEEIFSEASDGEAKPVTVDLSRTKQEISSVTLTKKSIENIAKAVADESSPADSLEVKLTNANMTLDGKAVEAVNGQAKGDDISLIVAAGRNIELNEAQQKVVENENVVTVIDVRILSNGREIHEFNGGIIKLEIDPDSKKLSDLKHCFVKYVSENGKLENVETSYDGKHIIFKTGHLSKYVIVYDESGENGTEAEAVKNVKAPYIKLSKTIGLGNTFNMAVTNVADNASVKYSSSDRKVATVDRNGVITAVGIGKCTVKGVIKQNGTTYKFAVAVSVKNTKKGNRHIKEDECLTPNSLTPLLNIYKAVSIAKPLKLNLKRLAADAVVTYSSEDESIAGVSEDGIVTGHKKGYTGIDVYVEQNGQILQYRVFVRVSGK